MGHQTEAGTQDSNATSQSENLQGIIGVDYTIEDYLTQRVIPFTNKDDYRTVVCPVCKGMVKNHKRRSLKIHNELGTWKCAKCFRSGRFDELKRLFGDTSFAQQAGSGRSFETWVTDFEPIVNYVDWVANTRSDEATKSMNYLRSLGLTDRDIRDKYFIGYDSKLDAITFSYQYERSPKTASYLRFFRRPDDWWKVTGNPAKASWYLQHLFKPGIDEAIICQTPIDAAVLSAVGEPNCLAPAINTQEVRYRTHQLAMLQRCGVVYIVPNPTDDGMRWAMATQRQVGKWRCKIVQVDFYPREVQSAGYDKWLTAKGKADSAAGISTAAASHWIADIDYEWDHPETTKGYPIGLEPLDKLLSGWRAGEITVLSGRSGIGKSTLACFLSLVQAVDTAMLYLTFEVLPKNIVRKWISMLADKAFHSLSREQYVSARKRLARRSIWIADNYGMVQLEDVRKSVYDACNRHSVRFVVIDHLGHLVSMGKEDETKESGNIIRECKRWALDLGVHILLVAHLRKPSAGDKARAKMEDLRGSSEIYQTADNIALLDRKNSDTDCIVRIVKCRDDSGYEGKAELGFDPLSLRYTPK